MKKLLIAAILLGTLVHADEAKGGVTALSPEVRGLLAEEMRHIEKGMQQIFSDMVRGNYEAVAKTATDIQNSFIFNRKLTDAQRKELKANIPKSFVTLDRSFHMTAGKLAEAAEFAEREKVQENFALMSQKCVQCHSTYATHRFPAFAEEE